MKIKAIDLEGLALEWAVATCNGYRDLHWHTYKGMDGHGAWAMYHNNGWMEIVNMQVMEWGNAGPIIEEEMITVGPAKHQGFMAWGWPKKEGFWGDTPIIAAMRCYVSSKLGDEVDVPDELMK